MTITIYDFDKTVYSGDSMVDFYLYSLSKKPSLIRHLPTQLFHILLFKLGFENRTQVKTNFFVFLKDIDDVDQYVADFWASHGQKLKRWYSDRDHTTDVIVSASPEFILLPLAQRLGIQKLIATRLDKKTGRIDGKNCYGSEKVNRLQQEFSDVSIVAAYTDSLSDMPVLMMAQEKYIVAGNKVMELAEYQKLNAIQRVLLS